jgi:hypothetical protein
VLCGGSEKQKFVKLAEALRVLKEEDSFDGNVPLAAARALADGGAGWSEARIRAWRMRETAPNAYYYRFNAPGEEQRNGAWSPVCRRLRVAVWPLTGSRRSGRCSLRARRSSASTGSGACSP